MRFLHCVVIFYYSPCLSKTKVSLEKITMQCRKHMRKPDVETQLLHTSRQREFTHPVSVSVLPIIFKERFSLFYHPTLPNYLETRKTLAELTPRLYSLFYTQKNGVKIVSLKLFCAFLSLFEIASRQFVVGNMYLPGKRQCCTYKWLHHKHRVRVQSATGSMYSFRISYCHNRA